MQRTIILWSMRPFFFYIINHSVIHLKVKVLVTQSCLILCDPLDCSLTVSSVHGILQARILEWVAIPFSKESSQSRDNHWSPAMQEDSEPPGKPFYYNKMNFILNSRPDVDIDSQVLWLTG